MLLDHGVWLSIDQKKLKSAIVLVTPKYKKKNLSNLVIYFVTNEVIELFAQTFKYVDYLPFDKSVLGVESFIGIG